MILEEPVSRLETPLSIDSIINKCSDFTIKSLDEEEIEKEEMDIAQVYTYDKLEPYCLMDNLEVASDDESANNDNISRSFPTFRKKMSNITVDGKVMKLVERGGVGTKVPDDGAIVVYVHYAAYVELAEYPFDVTRLRHKKPLRLKLGTQEIIPGLEIAIRSMKKQEKAKFLIHPDVAYKEGAPPRIPPHATILFDVELFDICEDVAKFNSDDEENPKTFEEKLNIAKQLRNRGNKMKTLEKNVNGAITKYKKCLSYLIQAHYQNEEEEKKAKEEILKAYVNLSICYMQKECYKKVCTMFNEAKHDCQQLAEDNVKLLYNSAKALRFLGNYDEATRRLRRAMRLKPGDKSVRAEIEKLDECKKNHQSNEKMACKKMFGFLKVTDNDDLDEIQYENIIQNVGSEFRDVFIESIVDFMKSEKETLKIDFGSTETAAEKEFMRRECHKRKLIIDHKSHGIIIKKPEI